MSFPLDHLSQGEISELVRLAQALQLRLKELGVTEYICIENVEVNRALGQCFLTEESDTYE